MFQIPTYHLSMLDRWMQMVIQLISASSVKVKINNT